MKRLCIVGGGVTRLRAPYKTDALIWSTMSVGQELPRVDAVFELHNGLYSAEQLNRVGCEVLSRETLPDVPKSKRFPIEKLIEKYGKRFNGTVVMILGYAGLMGFKEIELYGVDMVNEAEYSRRNAFYLMLGILEGHGVKVRIPEGGYLPLEWSTYMYEDSGLEWLEDTKAKAKAQIADSAANARNYELLKAYAQGTADCIANFERRF